MSVEVIKGGLHDTFQDSGRWGHQHLGINPGGAMDVAAQKSANALVGNNSNEAVLEMGFPSATLLFNEAALIALSGADFGATLDKKPIAINQPILVPAKTVLSFMRVHNGSFCYLALRGGFQLSDWLGSKSTNTKAVAGGWQGRTLKKGDCIPFQHSFVKADVIKSFNWKANVTEIYTPIQVIHCLKGNEFDELTKKSKTDFFGKPFKLGIQSDRMGYHFNGVELKQEKRKELISTAVLFGTVQLLPSGNMIALMADHQTTGGYPRIAQVVKADLPKLAQMRPGESVSFKMVTLQQAEDYWMKQENLLRKIALASALRLKAETTLSELE